MRALALYVAYIRIHGWGQGHKPCWLLKQSQGGVGSPTGSVEIVTYFVGENPDHALLGLWGSITQSPRQIQNVDPPKGSVIYTIREIGFRIESSIFCGDPPRALGNKSEGALYRDPHQPSIAGLYWTSEST